MFTVERRVGKLVEARVRILRTLEDVQRYELAVRTALLAAGPGAVGCSDMRFAEVFPPDVTSAIVQLLSRDNSALARSALLVADEQATLNLQIERIVREANNAARRTFRDPIELMAWLSGVLNTEERHRLHAFISEGATTTTTASGSVRPPRR